MAGGSKSGHGKPITGAGEAELSAFTKELREQSAPMREQLFSQMNEALTTGGIGARIPIINRAVEGSNAASSEAMRGLESDAATYDPNFAKSPFYQRMRNDIRSAGLRSAADIGPSIASSFIQQAPGLVLGTGNTTVTGLSNAADIGGRGAIAGRSLETQSQIAKGNNAAQMFSAFMGMAGKAMPAG